jgi:hypothetical protein
MGEDAALSFQLTAIDTTVLSNLVAWRKGVSSGTPFVADGQAGPRGVPIYSAGRHIRLGFQFAATFGGSPLFFPVTRLLEPRTIEAGTQFSTIGLAFAAWSVYALDGSGNTTWSPLYSNVDTQV